MRKIKGRKRHFLVDTDGFLLQVIVHEASTQDRDGAISRSPRTVGRGGDDETGALAVRNLGHR